MSAYTFTRMEDFKKDGRIDWSAYNAAQEANGERCTECKTFIVFGRGYADRCADCKRADQPAEMDHHCFVRCPACGYKENVFERESSSLFQDGEHEIYCSSCEHKFTVCDSYQFFVHQSRASSGGEMSEKSHIEWTDATWNPVLGCDKISPGCKKCYAIRTARRLQHNPNPKVAKAYEGLTVIQGGQPNWTGRVNFVPDRLDQPLHWKEPRMIFVNSQSDLFHEDLTDYAIDQIFAVMAKSPQHTFQVLTKRPERMQRYLSDTAMRGFGLGHDVIMRIAILMDLAPAEVRRNWPLSNVWLGVSCENQATSDERIPLLLQTPAAVRWVSAGPLLGSINFRMIGARPKYPIDALTGAWAVAENLDGHYKQENRIHWIVVEGESGPGARPMHPDWARSIRDQCQAAGVPFFFKQWGEYANGGNPTGQIAMYSDGRYCAFTREAILAEEQRSGIAHKNAASVVMSRVGKKRAGRLLDGKEWSEYPQVAEAVTA